MGTVSRVPNRISYVFSLLNLFNLDIFHQYLALPRPASETFAGQGAAKARTNEIEGSLAGLGQRFGLACAEKVK
jgi:hypothetical protein